MCLWDIFFVLENRLKDIWKVILKISGRYLEGYKEDIWKII